MTTMILFFFFSSFRKGISHQKNKKSGPVSFIDTDPPIFMTIFMKFSRLLSKRWCMNALIVFMVFLLLMSSMRPKDFQNYRKMQDKFKLPQLNELKETFKFDVEENEKIFDHIRNEIS